MFNNYLSARYEYLKSYIISKTGNQEEGIEILHFTIDYFYRKYSKEKLDDLINQDGGKGMDSYIIKSLYLNSFSDSAPYRQSYFKHQHNAHYEYDLDSIADDTISHTPSEVDYISNILIKLINNPYVKKKFRSQYQYEYSKKIFYLHINENITYKEISDRTNISINTLRYNFDKLKKILFEIISDEDLLIELLPNETIDNIYSGVNKKLNKYRMDYYEAYNQYVKNLPNVPKKLLKIAASQKVKKQTNNIVRDKVNILIDIKDHLVRCKGIVANRGLAQERIDLYHEFIGKTTSYNNPGCGSCMDMVTRQINNIIFKHNNLLIV